MKTRSITKNCMISYAQVVRTVNTLQGSDAHRWAGNHVAMMRGYLLGKGEWVKRKDLLAAIARLKKGKP